jgi:hypothetical protein
MPTLTDSILDIRDSAPPHDYLLVAGDTRDVSNVASDALHAARQISADVVVYYRGVLVKVDPQSDYSEIVTGIYAKLEDPPDKDPVASDFPAET